MPCGSLYQLVSQASQDVYLTIDPAVTKFKSVYRRHSNFGIECIDVEFDKDPDFGKRVTATFDPVAELLHKIYIRVELPEIIPEFNRVKNACFGLFNNKIIDLYEINTIPNPDIYQKPIIDFTVEAGVITEIEILNPNNNFSLDEYIFVFNPEGADAELVIEDNKVTDIIINDGGIGYDQNTSTIEICFTPLDPILEINTIDLYEIIDEKCQLIKSGIINSISVLFPGKGIMYPVNLQINTLTGTGFIGEAVLDNGRIQKINIVNGGCDYLETDEIIGTQVDTKIYSVNSDIPPETCIEFSPEILEFKFIETIEIKSSFPIQDNSIIDFYQECSIPNPNIFLKPTIEFTLKNLCGITEIKIVNSQGGYICPPNIIIDSSGSILGVGATAEAILANGFITEIKVTNPGIKYFPSNTDIFLEIIKFNEGKADVLIEDIVSLVSLVPNSFIGPVPIIVNAPGPIGLVRKITLLDPGQGYVYPSLVKVRQFDNTITTIGKTVINQGKIIDILVTNEGSGFYEFGNNPIAEVIIDFNFTEADYISQGVPNNHKEFKFVEKAFYAPVDLQINEFGTLQIGSGYVTPPEVLIIGGDGNASFFVFLNTLNDDIQPLGSIISIFTTNRGSGYDPNTTTVGLSDPADHVGTEGKIMVTNRFTPRNIQDIITDISVVNDPAPILPSFTFETECEAVPEGKIEDIIIVNSGNAWDTLNNIPDITFDSKNGVGAMANIVINAGVPTINITNQGTGYTSDDLTVTIDNINRSVPGTYEIELDDICALYEIENKVENGINFIEYKLINSNTLINVKITNPGSGYLFISDDVGNFETILFISDDDGKVVDFAIIIRTPVFPPITRFIPASFEIIKTNDEIEYFSEFSAFNPLPTKKLVYDKIEGVIINASNIITNPGSGYIEDTVEIIVTRTDFSVGTEAKIIGVIVNNELDHILIQEGGSNYTAGFINLSVTGNAILDPAQLIIQDICFEREEDLVLNLPTLDCVLDFDTAPIGQICTIDVINPGNGYNLSNYQIEINSVEGFGGEAVPIIENCTITEVKVIDMGNFYFPGDVEIKLIIENPIPAILEIRTEDIIDLYEKIVVIDPITLQTCTSYNKIRSGVISNIRIVNGGVGHVYPPVIEIKSNTGSGALAEAVINNGSVIAIQMINGGNNYQDIISVEAINTLTLEDCPESAENIVQYKLIEKGVIREIQIIKPGLNYLVPPCLTIDTKTGKDAILEPIIIDGKITSVKIINGGTCYQIGDLIITENINLRNTFSYSPKLGHAILSKLEFDIGDQILDTHYGQWLDVFHEFNIPREKINGYNRMIGHVPELFNTRVMETIPARTLYIPMQFWLCRRSESALPLIALQYHQVRLHAEFEELRRCVRIGPDFFVKIDILDLKVTGFVGERIVADGLAGIIQLDNITKDSKVMFFEYFDKTTTQSFQFNQILTIQHFNGSESTIQIKSRIIQVPNFAYNNISIKDADVLADYIFINDFERERFARFPHEYIIEQLQFNGLEYTNGIPAIYDLEYNFLVKSLYWVIKIQENVDRNDFNNYTDQITDVFGRRGNNPLISARLQFNGYYRFREREFQYFNWVHPYNFCDNIPPDGINLYSFGLHPIRPEPSGTLNFSSVGAQEFLLEFDQTNIQIDKPAELYLYGHGYNILRIENGLGSLFFHK